MDGDVLGLAIKAAVDTVVAGGGPVDRDAMFKAMGHAIVEHVQAYGQVVVTSVSGVTAGAGVSGPGAGTIT